MEQFWSKIGFTIILVSVAHIGVAFLGDGKTDAYYLRLTTPHQKSLILGTSRAAQGIFPEKFQDLMDTFDLEGPIYNFAFTAVNSPYGANYYDAIQHKLDSTTKKGLFILTIDPWSISSLKSNLKNKKGEREADLFLGNLNCYTCNPNFEYLFKFYSNNWGHILVQKWSEKELNIEPLGRLAVNIDMDTISIRKRTEEKIAQYQKQLTQYKLSPIRQQKLLATIELLKQHGSVILVRLPISEPMIEIEQQLAPYFDQTIMELAHREAVPYLNYVGQFKTFDQYTDGNHLAPNTGAEFSRLLAHDIQSILRAKYLRE